MEISQFLSLEFSYLQTKKYKWIYIISASLFVLVFLILFRPFGLAGEFESPINSTLDISTFLFSISFTTFLGLYLSQFMLRPLVKGKVKIKEYFLWLIFEAFILTSFNFVIAFFIPDLGHDPIEEELNFQFQFFNFIKCISILLFPFMGTILYEIIQSLNDEVKELETTIEAYKITYKNLDAAHQYLIIRDENDNLELKLKLDNFLFAESGNQYVIIHYLEQDVIKKHIVRTRLKKLLESYTELPLKQCHRSYAINLMKIKSLKRNDGKLFLLIDNVKAFKVPVSKSYMEEIKELVSK